VFRFTLAAALQRRRDDELLAQLTLARALRVARTLSLERDALSAELHALQPERSSYRGPADSELRLVATRVAWALQSGRRICNALDAVNVDVERARSAVTASAVARRALELLEERQRAEYERRRARAETRELEEANAALLGNRNSAR
jgi:hypothetical protein